MTKKKPKNSNNGIKMKNSDNSYDSDFINNCDDCIKTVNIHNNEMSDEIAAKPLLKKCYVRLEQLQFKSVKIEAVIINEEMYFTSGTTETSTLTSLPPAVSFSSHVTINDQRYNCDLNSHLSLNGKNKKRKRYASSRESSSSSDETNKTKGNVKTELSRNFGMPNLGNTCYVNSIIHVLRITPGFAQFLHILNDHVKRLNVKRAAQLDINDRNLITSLHDIFVYFGNDLNLRKNESVEQMLQIITKSISETFKKGLQQDSHEFLFWLINRLNSIGQWFSISKDTKDESIIDCDRSVESLLKYHNVLKPSINFHNFNGLMKQDVTCNACNNCNPKSEFFCDIQIPLFDEEYNTDAITTFTDFIHKPVLFNGENKFHCGNCFNYTDALMVNRIEKSPKVLVLHIKKQINCDNSFPTAKQFNFPYPLLEYYSDLNQLHQYKLYALVIHVGMSINNGHYYALIDSSNPEEKIVTRRRNACQCSNFITEDMNIDWIKIDDRKVRIISNKELPEFMRVNDDVTPYLAFYSMIR